MMTPREKFKATINFREPDSLPWIESFSDETMIKWLGEGLPARYVINIEWEITTSLLNKATVKGFSPHSFFGCQNLFGCLVPIDTGPLPRFKLEVLGQSDRYVEVQTETGAIARRLKKENFTWYSMPMFKEFPVKDRKSWEEYKKRLNPSDPRRYPKDWDVDAYARVLNAYDAGNTILSFDGFYGFGAEIMGIPSFLTSFYRDPELVHEIAEHWEYFTIETIREAVEALKDKIDVAFWWEDMAEKHGPNISPRIYKEFLLPHYKRVTSFLRKNKIDRVLMDSDGNINQILDSIVEAGITGIWPMEVNSGMDAISIRKKYGKKLFTIGNLDKRELAKGGDALRREIDSKVLILKEMGGHVPAMDHSVHIEFTYARFLEYVDYLKKYLGN